MAVLAEGELRLGDDLFPIETVVLMANLTKDSLVWALEVLAADGSFLGSDCKPAITCDEICESGAVPGQPWDAAFSEVIYQEGENNERCGWLYVFEHNPMVETSVEILSGDRGEFDLVLNGRGEVSSDEVVPVKVTARGAFSGVYTRIADEKEARVCLSSFLDSERFDFRIEDEEIGIALFTLKH